MSLNDKIGKIVAEKFLVKTKTDGTISLREKAASMTITLTTDMRFPVITIRIQKLRHWSALKPGPWTKTCDYLLLFEWKGKCHAVFVELKKTLRGTGAEGSEQLRRSLPLLKYLQSVYEVEFGPKWGKTGLSIDYCLICEKDTPRLDKQPVRVDLSRRTDEIEHKDITVRTFVGLPRIAIADLVTET